MTFFKKLTTVLLSTSITSLLSLASAADAPQNNNNDLDGRKSYLFFTQLWETDASVTPAAHLSRAAQLGNEPAIIKINEIRATQWYINAQNGVKPQSSVELMDVDTASLTTQGTLPKALQDAQKRLAQKPQDPLERLAYNLYNYEQQFPQLKYNALIN